MATSNMKDLINQAKSGPSTKTLQKVTPLSKKVPHTQFSVYIENDLLKRLKFKALEEEQSIKFIIHEALENHLK